MGMKKIVFVGLFLLTTLQANLGNSTNSEFFSVMAHNAGRHEIYGCAVNVYVEKTEAQCEGICERRVQVYIKATGREYLASGLTVKGDITQPFPNKARIPYVFESAAAKNVPKMYFQVYTASDGQLIWLRGREVARDSENSSYFDCRGVRPRNEVLQRER